MALNDRSDQVVRAFVRSDLPGNIKIDDDFRKYLTGEFDLIQQVLSEANDSAPQVSEAVPASLRKGMVRYAVAPWDPLGTGFTGYVYYNGSAWVKGIAPLTAADIANVPAGNIAAVNVQTALNELDTEKVPTTRAVNTGTGLTGGGDLSIDRTHSLATRAANSIMGNNTGSAATPIDLTGTQATAMLDAMGAASGGAGALKGLAPATAAGDNVKFLRGDATWAVPSTVTKSEQDTSTAATSYVLLNNTLPSTATKIRITFNGVSTNTASQPGLIQVGTGSTPTWVTSGYVVGEADIAAASAAREAVTDGWRLARTTNATAAALISGFLELRKLRAGANTWVACGIYNIDAATPITGVIAGNVTPGAAVTSLRIITPGGAATFDAGYVCVEYE
jgi:hypothetical protein